MAIAFNKHRGAAKKGSVDTVKFEEGLNSFRIVGDILARYVYWVKGQNDKNIPFECLSFDREEEAFLNEEKDWVKEFYPDLKCGWSYAVQAIDPKDGKVKVMNLKKKLWEQIINAAEDLGDPTDVEAGWDLVFKKTKTGPLAYNVEYNLMVLKCKIRALSDEELEAIKDLKSMDVVMPRPTPDAQKALLDKINSVSSPEADDEESIDELDIT